MTTFTIFLFILLTLIVFLFCYKIFKTEKEMTLMSKGWVDKKDYPHGDFIYKNKKIIMDDLNSVLATNQWSIWSSDKYSTPIFTKMSNNEILDRLKENKGKIGSIEKPSWRLYGLILNGQKTENANTCPNTLELIKKLEEKYPKNKILNAGFSVLEPRCHIGRHKDFNNTFYRIHIPLILPKNNIKKGKTQITQSEAIDENLAVFCLENDYVIWNHNEYFIFDDTFEHDAWNYSDEMRIVMIIDVLK